MEGKDNIKELFSQKLGNYEAPVNPELWANISSQVAAAGTAATASSTGLSLLAKVGICLGISAAAITTVVLVTSSPEEIVSDEPTSKVEVQKETPTTTTTKEEEEQVAEVSDQKVIDFDEFRENNEFTGDDTADKNSSETSSDSTPNESKSTQTSDPDPVIGTMPTRSPSALTGDKTSQPTIVEGVTYHNGALVNTEDPDELEETTTPKVEPIKRFVNVFTPNGDGEHDEFFLESEGLSDFTIIIFNPAGDIVFQSNDSQFRWDGRDMRTGEMVKSGENYMYMVTAYDSEGNPYPIYERLRIKY